MLGRQRSGLVALTFAAAIMVVVTPRVLWDAAFQMSFAAMAGLILIVPPIQTLGRNLVSSKLKDIKNMVAMIAARTTGGFMPVSRV